MLSRQQLQRTAAESGFQVESYEKVHMLVGLLEAIRTHPFLGPRMALKGGTALNLFVLELPRLSVDIDLNFIGGAERESMLAARPRVEEALQQVAGRAGLIVKRVPTEHAGGKWRLSYTSALGRANSIELDVNFMLRTPLWPPTLRDSHAIGGEKATHVLLLDEHELAAGKLAALVARSASRDVFDARELLRRPGWDRTRLRLGFVIYGGCNRVDWRSIGLDNIQATAAEVDAQLVPMLRFGVRPTQSDVEMWTRDLLRETRELMAMVFPFSDNELEFLERINGFGDIAPELLTSDSGLQAILREHPGLKWKALNVKKHLGA
ncbi:MAG TPA: nucleotidyl transferase AbiEii/AbiGii toxin family protein [Polyangiaceae bacterium]|nr:nucleotidyl transferase AbiEii/AbiGii toxin family protein [Polyangiaceae bacterium]